MPIKLNEMLIDSCVVFFAFLGRLKRLFTKRLFAKLQALSPSLVLPVSGQNWFRKKTLQTAQEDEKRFV